MRSFPVVIVSPDKDIAEFSAVSLVVPAGLGYAGILAGHAPFISLLKPGKIFLRQEDGGQFTLENLAYGFVRVLDNRVTIVIDQTKNA
jgi:F-type H+-transporting ATPase subunit epsilon